MRLSADLSEQFYEKEVNITCYMLNKSPLTAIDCNNPQVVCSGKPYENSFLQMFRFPAYAHVDDGKMESRAMNCIFLGYAYGGKGHRLWCTEEGKSQKFIISRDVAFKSSMCNQRRGGTSVVGNDRGATMLARRSTDTPHSFVINEKQQSDMEQNRHDEFLEQPRKDVYGDVIDTKLNLKNFLEIFPFLIDCLFVGV